MKRKASFLILLLLFAAAAFILAPATAALAGEPRDFSGTRNADGSVTVRWSGGEEGETLRISRLDTSGRRLGPAVNVPQERGEFRDDEAPAGPFYYEAAWGPLRRSAVFLAIPGTDGVPLQDLLDFAED